jgi:hypothetical protein
VIFTVKRIQGGWEIHDENSKEKISVMDGAVISYTNEPNGTGIYETVSEKTKPEALIKAWKGQ